MMLARKTITRARWLLLLSSVMLFLAIYAFNTHAHIPVYKPGPPPTILTGPDGRPVDVGPPQLSGPPTSGGGTQKPPPPPGGSTGGSPGGGPYTHPGDLPGKPHTRSGPPSLPVPGGSRPGGIPGGVTRAGGGPVGGITRKATAAASTQVTWEYWWARNRYQYLEFPKLPDRIGHRYPRTPTSGTTDRLARLKAQSLDLTRPLLQHRSARLRKAALVGLAMLNDEESLSEMLKLLLDENQTVRDSVLLALGMMKSVEAKHILLHVAKATRNGCQAIGQSSIPDYFRGFAQVSLALEDTRGISTSLRSIASDQHASPEVRAMALEGLGLLGGEDGAKFLMQFLENNQVSPILLAAAVSAVGKTMEPFTVPFLEKCLSSRHLAVQQSAALALGPVAVPGDDRILKRLQRGFRHSSDQALKGFSLISLGMIGGPDAIRFLDQVVAKGSRSDRPWACIGLGFALQRSEGNHERALKHLLSQASDGGNRSTCGAAAIALGLCKCREAVEPLIEILRKGDDPALRGHAALALGMIGDPAAAGPLRKSLKEEGVPQMLIHTAMALALINDTDSIPYMIDLLLRSNNDIIQGFIALSLSYMADIRVVEKLMQAMEEGGLDDITVLHCVHLNSRLLSGRTEPYLNRLAAGSNFANEYPLVDYLLDFGI